MKIGITLSVLTMNMTHAEIAETQIFAPPPLLIGVLSFLYLFHHQTVSPYFRRYIIYGLRYSCQMYNPVSRHHGLQVFYDFNSSLSQQLSQCYHIQPPTPIK